MGRIHQAGLKRIVSYHPEYSHVDVFIETGTDKGTQTKIAAQCFRVVEAIELDEHRCKLTREAVREFTNVNLHQGDTAQILPKVLERYASTPVFAYLDAHYYPTRPPLKKTPLPLWSELALFRLRDQKDIILVDDTHVFGKKCDHLRYKEGAIEWEGVTVDSILSFFGNTVFDSMLFGGGFIVWKK